MADLEERFRSLARTPTPDLWADLQERDPRAMPASSPAPRVTAAAVALVVAIGGFAWAVWVFGGAAPAVRAPASVQEGRIAFAALGDGTWQVYSVRPDGTELLQITHVQPPDVVSEPTWSPDGSKLSYVVRPSDTDRSEIWVSDADGTNAHPVVQDMGAREPSWSPDGMWIAFTRSGGLSELQGPEAGRSQIWITRSDGTNVHAFTHCGSECIADSSPAWSPDGARIAFIRESGAGAVTPFSIFVWPVELDLIPTNIALEGATFAQGLGWSPDGSRFAFTRSFDDGGTFGISVVGADGSGHTQLSAPPSAQAPAWSPDGTQIVFMVQVGAEHETLYVMNADGSDPHPIEGLPLNASWPSWQPGPPGSAPTPTPTAPASVSVSVEVDVIRDVAEFPSAVAVGEGGVWVTAPRQDGSDTGDVIRLDPTTGEILTTIPVDSAPGWDFGGAGLTTGAGSVWVAGISGAGPRCCAGLVTRIDAATNQVVDEIEIASDDKVFAADVWVEASDLYVLLFDIAGSDPGLELAKLDISTHEELWRAPIPGQWSQTVFVSGGSVWVLGTRPDAHGPISVTTLYRLDPGDGSLTQQVPLAASVHSPAVQAETLWFRAEEGAQRFDTATGAYVGEPVQPAPGCCTGAFVSDGADGVWVMSSPGAGIERSIWHIDATGHVVATGTFDNPEAFENAGGLSYAFDPVTQTIWVQQYGNSVALIRIEPR